MINRLIPALGFVLLAAACEWGPMTTPTTVSPVTGTPIASPADPSNPAPIPGTSVSAGTLVEGTIDDGDPVCFPSWDSSGHCRQFDLTARADGKVLATLTWAGPSRGLLYDPDLFLVAPDGTRAYSQDAWPEKHVDLPARSGLTYRIVVISYGSSALAFALIADLRP
jgi:hypothetical protein